MDLQFTEWRKSSFSGPPDNDCVEVSWRKSSFSSPPDNDCVEVSFSSIVGLRDSKNPAAGALVFDRSSWQTFLTTV